jgi:hypothetical protein
VATWGDPATQRAVATARKSAKTYNWGTPTQKNTSYVTGQPNTKAPQTPPAASSGGSGLPLDPTYQATIGGLQHKRDDALAQYAGQRPKVLADYGYTASGYDAQGNPLGLAFDPNNPFSRAALAKRTADQVKAGTQNSMASRGQLYSGALEQAQAGNEFNYQQGSDALQKALVGALGGIAAGERGAKTDYELGAGQALGESVGRAQNAPPTPPPAAAAPAGRPNAGGNPYPPGTSEWAAFASQHGQSWKQTGGKWYRKGASGQWIPAG